MLVCLTAERVVVSVLDASCRAPVAVYAQLKDGQLAVEAFVGLVDGSTWIRDELRSDPTDPVAAGDKLAQRLVAVGAKDVLEQAEKGAR